jgi:pyrroline-5-carboxylate reductase
MSARSGSRHHLETSGMTHRLGIIGGGNMGHAIVRGAIEGGILAADEVIVAETDASRRQALKDLGCATAPSTAAATAAEQLMLAVKPQSFGEVAASIVPLPRSMVIISIMAGLGSARIRSTLGEEARVVRVMPNTPCQVGEGATAIARGDGARDGDETLARSIFDALGRTTSVPEEHLHAVTAVSGSGPAYVFLLAEAMLDAAAQMGLEPDAARLLVTQTVRGAGHLLTASPDVDAAALRKAVTSPGGTTAAALEVMLDRDLPGIVIEALAAARDRGVELNG